MPITIGRKSGLPLASSGVRLASNLRAEEPGALGSTLSALGSGIGYVGETLAKPSRALWSTAEGLASGDWSGGGPLNLLPFSDTLGITDPSQSVELPEFLENRGLLPENEPGFDMMDIPRFGLYVAGDPLSYAAGLGTAKALGRGGQALSRAGVLDDVTRASGKGPREFLSSTGFRDSLSGLSRPQLRSVRESAQQMGYRGLKDLSEQAPGPLGGQLGIGGIFRQPSATLGSPRLGRAIDTGLRKVAESPLGLESQRLFSPAVRGGRNLFEQTFGRKSFAGREAVEREVDAFTQKMHERLGRIDPRLQTEEGFGELRSVLEQLESSGVPFAQDVEKWAADMHGALSRFHEQANKVGVDIGDLTDEFARYFPRGKHGPIFDAHEMARHGHLRDIPGGTETVREMMRDQDLHALVDQNAKTKDIAAFLRDRYGQPIDPESPLFYEHMVDDVLAESRGRWAHDVAQWKANRERLQPLAEFKKQHPKWVRLAKGEGDRANVPQFDVFGEEFINAHPDIARNLDELWDALRNDVELKPPKPTRESVSGEAAARAEAQRAQQSFTDPAGEEAISNEFVRLDSKGRPILDESGRPKIGDRFQALAKTAKNMTPEQREVGLFRTDPLDDAYRYLSSVGRKIVIGDSITESLANPAFQRNAVARSGEAAEPLWKVLRNSKDPSRAIGLNPETVAKNVLESQGKTATKKSIRSFLRTPIKKDAAERLVKMSRFGTDPKDRNLLHKLYLWAHNAFKAGVTSPFPAFHTRNYMSAQIANMLDGILRPTRALAENKNTYRLINGGVVPDAHQIPAVKNMLRERGLEATAENGTQMLRELVATHRVWDPSGAVGWGTDVIGTAEGTADQPLSRLLGRQPGRTPMFGERGPLTEIPRQYLGVGEGVTLNPLRAQMRGGASGAERSTLGPLAAGETAGAWIEGQNRLPAFMDQLRRGVDPLTAARKVAEVQVEYGNRAFTESEQAVKQVIPFYSFNRKMANYVAGELANRPGGPLAQVIKQTARAGEEDLHGEAAIPLGETPSGSQRFLSGLGMMHESPLSMIGTRGGQLSLAETGAALAGATTPFIKGPLEAVTGESFFQRGPLGGREVTSQDPLMGGVRANIGQLLGEDRAYPAEPVGGRTLEQIAANTPLSRLLSTARTATDKRKWEGGLFPGATLGLQLGSGLRFTDVSPQQRLRMLEDQITADIRDRGGYIGRFATFTKRDIEAADPEEAAEMERLNESLREVRRLRQELQEEKPKVRFRKAG